MDVADVSTVMRGCLVDEAIRSQRQFADWNFLNLKVRASTYSQFSLTFYVNVSAVWSVFIQCMSWPVVDLIDCELVFLDL